MSKETLNVSVIIPVYNNGLYLRETLQSLEKQILKEFEVIVVNDGSSDNSEEIIDEFVKRDQRFKKISQKNQGVSAARNAALEIAKGTYVTFVDGDDTLPENSLQAMNQVAVNTNAELVIGGIQRVDGFTKKVNQRVEKLGTKQKILKDDLDLVHGLSLCNKWFLKEIIDEHHLRLEKFRHLEDGVFLYNFLQYANEIQYCDVIVYNYLKRVPTITGSVTQKVEKGLLESAISAFERLQELTVNYSEEFQQELAYRINSTTFIGDYYKKIWYLDKTTEQLLITYVNRIWESQSEDHKARTLSSHPGLKMDQGLQDKEALLENTIFTIVICPIVSREKINVILKSIYGQAMPAFQVILDESYRRYIDHTFLGMKNITFVSLGITQQEWLDFSWQIKNTRYVVYIDQDVIFDHDALSKTYKAFKAKKYEALKMRVIQSVKLIGLAGFVFDINSKRTDEKFDCPTQKDAWLISMQDMDRVEELTRPTKLEKIKHVIKKIIKRR